jgi:hypothetical protein
LQSARLAIQEGRIDNKKKKRKEEKGSDAMGGRKEEGQMQTQPHRARRQRANSGLRQSTAAGRGLKWRKNDDGRRQSSSRVMRALDPTHGRVREARSPSRLRCLQRILLASSKRVLPI